MRTLNDLIGFAQGKDFDTNLSIARARSNQFIEQRTNNLLDKDQYEKDLAYRLSYKGLKERGLSDEDISHMKGPCNARETSGLMKAGVNQQQVVTYDLLQGVRRMLSFGGCS